MSEQPQPGDKVRVTSIVDKNGRYGGSMSVEDGLFGATLEILERADDPSRDEIGTVAELDGAVWVKVELDAWCSIGTTVWYTRINKAMQGRGVTGAVLGTPAAQARQHPTDYLAAIREFERKNGPLVADAIGHPAEDGTT